MNRRSFLKALGVMSAVIMVPVITKPKWISVKPSDGDSHLDAMAYEYEMFTHNHDDHIGIIPGVMPI